MKKFLKFLPALVILISVNANAEDPPIHYCSFTGSTQGQLEAKPNGSEYLLGADDSIGLGIPASVSFRWLGSTVMIVNAVNNINKSGGGAPQVNINTGVRFNNATNNAAASAAHNFNTGFKSIAIMGTSTEQQDTMHVKMVARSSSAFPVGTYDASTTVTCF